MSDITDLILSNIHTCLLFGTIMILSMLLVVIGAIMGNAGFIFVIIGLVLMLIFGIIWGCTCGITNRKIREIESKKE